MASDHEHLGRVATVTIDAHGALSHAGHVEVLLDRSFPSPVVRLARSGTALSFTRNGAAQLAGLLLEASDRLAAEATPGKD